MRPVTPRHSRIGVSLLVLLAVFTCVGVTVAIRDMVYANRKILSLPIQSSFVSPRSETGHVASDRTVKRGPYTVVIMNAATLKARPVTLTYIAELSARAVTVAGSFNGWNTTSHSLRNVGDHTWIATILLPRGSHQYKYVVDGNWIADPSAAHVQDDQNNVNAVLNISPTDDTDFFFNQLNNAPGNYIRVGLDGGINQYTEYTETIHGEQWCRAEVLVNGKRSWGPWKNLNAK